MVFIDCVKIEIHCITKISSGIGHTLALIVQLSALDLSKCCLW